MLFVNNYLKYQWTKYHSQNTYSGRLNEQTNKQTKRAYNMSPTKDPLQGKVHTTKSEGMEEDTPYEWKWPECGDCNPLIRQNRL